MTKIYKCILFNVESNGVQTLHSSEAEGFTANSGWIPYTDGFTMNSGRIPNTDRFHIDRNIEEKGVSVIVLEVSGRTNK